MPVYVPSSGPGALASLDLFEFLGSYLAGQYQALEAYLVGEIARRVSRDLDVTAQNVRLTAIRELQTTAAAAIAAVNTEALANSIVATAASEGEAAAAAALNLTPGLADKAVSDATGAEGKPIGFATGLTPNAVIASAQIALELRNNLEQVNARILRAVPDVYQETIARFATRRLLGGQTGRDARRQAATDFLSQGITGFTDKAGRNWSIGGYTEMAARTATNRAWIDANTAMYARNGFDLVSIVRGSDACRFCAPWSGKVLSLSGRSGDVTEEHATTGAPTVVHIDGTLASARAAGWNHPNCRCTVVAVFPGLSRPIDDTTYDPQAERDREKLRALERKVRKLKLEQSTLDGMGGNDIDRAALKRRIRETQGDIRDHVAATGQIRKPYREQLSFQTGKAGPLPPKPRAIEPPKPPALPAPRARTPEEVLGPRPVHTPTEGYAGRLDVQKKQADWDRGALQVKRSNIKIGAAEPLPAAKFRTQLETAKNGEEVAAQLAAQVQARGITVTGFTKRTDVQTAREYAGTVASLLERYPTVVMDEIALGRMGERTYAYVQHSPIGHITMKMSTSFATNRTKLLENLARDVEKGFHPKGVDGVQGIISHEFGHAIDAQTKFVVGRTARKTLVEFGATLGLRDGSAAFNTWQKATLPGYAFDGRGSFNGTEAIAEAFADVEVNGAAALPVHRALWQRLIDGMPK